MKVLGYQFSVQKSPENKNKEATAGKSSKTNPVVIKITQSFKDSSRKDIDQWRRALRMAQHPEEPKMAAYYDLLDDLLTDGHLQSQIQLRKTSSLNTDFQIINRNTGETDENGTFIFRQQWFYEFLGYVMDSLLFGTTLAEFTAFEGEKIRVGILPRRHIIPQLGRILPDVTKDTEYINYRDPQFSPYILQIGKNDDLGLLNNIVPNIIWKRNVAQSWAEFCEKFGMPLITATSNSADAEASELISGMLGNLGEAGTGVFPVGTDIQLHETNRTDAYNVYMQFMQANDNQISKQLVGSTMLSDQGTNRSQTEVHERSLDYRIAQADKRFIQFVVNDQLFPLLRMHGYALSDDLAFEFKTAEQEVELTELWNITSGMLMNGYKVDAEWLSKTFNIPLENPKTDTAGKSNPPIQQ